MNYAVIKDCDIANGPGVRTSLFVSGCRHHCKGCFNPETWNFSYGSLYTDETANQILDVSDHPFVTGLTLLGGEPFEPENQAELAKLAKKFKQRFPQKTIWCYSGYSFEDDLLPKAQKGVENVRELLETIDVLVDGRFVEELKDSSLLFRGSSNQNIIDVKRSLAEDKLIWLEGKWKRTPGSGDIYEK